MKNLNILRLTPFASQTKSMIKLTQKLMGQILPSAHANSGVILAAYCALIACSLAYAEEKASTVAENIMPTDVSKTLEAIEVQLRLPSIPIEPFIVDIKGHATSQEIKINRDAFLKNFAWQIYIKYDDSSEKFALCMPVISLNQTAVCYIGIKGIASIQPEYATTYLFNHFRQRAADYNIDHISSVTIYLSLNQMTREAKENGVFYHSNGITLDKKTFMSLYNAFGKEPDISDYLRNPEKVVKILNPQSLSIPNTLTSTSPVQAPSK